MKHYYLLLGILAALFLGYAKGKAAEGQAPPIQRSPIERPRIEIERAPTVPKEPPTVVIEEPGLEGPKCPPGWFRPPGAKPGDMFICIPVRPLPKDQIKCPPGTIYFESTLGTDHVCLIGCRPAIK